MLTKLEKKIIIMLIFLWVAFNNTSALCSETASPVKYAISSDICLFNNESDDDLKPESKRYDAQSFQLAGSMFWQDVGATIFFKRLNYTEREQNHRNEPLSVVRLNDTIKGAGIQYLIGSLNIAIGRAFHTIQSAQDVPRRSLDRRPSGPDVGNFATIGWAGLPLAANADFLINLSYFRLEKSQFEMIEYTWGVRCFLENGKC